MKAICVNFVDTYGFHYPLSPLLLHPLSPPLLHGRKKQNEGAVKAWASNIIVTFNYTSIIGSIKNYFFITAFKKVPMQ